jgi:hypothetical protein
MYKHDETWRARNLKKQKTWYVKHKSAALAASKHRRVMSFQMPVITGSFRVIEVLHDGVPCYVGLERSGTSFVDQVWQVRCLVENPLTTFLRTLERPPETQYTLGVGLNFTAAYRLLKLRRRQLDATDAKTLWRVPSNRRRPVCRTRNGVVERFATVTDAAHALGVSHKAILVRLDRYHPDGMGWSWWDTY